jgi:hypothetical protein
MPAEWRRKGRSVVDNRHVIAVVGREYKKRVSRRRNVQKIAEKVIRIKYKKPSRGCSGQGTQLTCHCRSLRAPKIYEKKREKGIKRKGNKK